MIFCAQAAAVTPQEPGQENSLIEGIRVDVKDFYGNEKQWVDMVQSIASTYIKTGDRFSSLQVKRLATALKACRRFRSIHLDSEMTETGLSLLITVTPFRLIKSIKIRGKYPLFEKQIRNVMTIHSGSSFVVEEVDKQSQLIAELYRRYGYIDPKIGIESILDAENGYYFIDVSIETGRPYRLSRFEMTGNTAFETPELRWKMKSVRTSHAIFSEKVFLEDIEKLIAFYRRQGFPDIAIEHQLEKNPQTGKVEVHVAVNEGDRYDVSFIGNTAFGKRALKKELALFKTGNRRGTGLRKSTRNISEKYRQAGYEEIAVKVETEEVMEENIPVRKLHFIIDEGMRSIVRKIVISGNTSFTDEVLKKQMLTRPPGWMHDGEYIAERLEQDILAIENLYQGNGYLDVTLEKTVTHSPDRGNTVVDLTIHEGLQTRVSRVTLEGLTAVPEASVKEKIQIYAGKPFARGELNADENRIALMVSEKGYPYVQVTGEATLSEDHTKAEVVYRVLQNAYVERGKTFYAGNFRTKEKIFQQELVMKPGDPFSLKKMTEGQQGIRSMNIFRSVAFQTVGLKEEAETIHLFTEMEEEKPLYFEVAGGLASEKGLYTGSTIGDRNFLGSNKDLKVKGEVSETGYNGESRLFEPRFLGTRISSDLGVYGEHSKPFNQNFGTNKLGTDLQLSRKWKKYVKLGLGFNLERREQFSRDNDVDEDDVFDPRIILTVTPSIRYDSRDNFLNPKKGLFGLLEVNVSKGIENSLDNYYKPRLDLRAYATPVKRLTFAGRGTAGRINRYDARGKIPDDQLFFLGGTATVRGFDENRLLTDRDNDPVGGKLMFLGNAEARIALGYNFEVSFFYDIGYLGNTPGDERSPNVRSATGVGFRYVTPVGAIGLAYGYKLNPEPYESAGRLHFSIGYTF